MKRFWGHLALAALVWLNAVGTVAAAPVSSYPPASTPLSGTEQMLSTQNATTVNITPAMVSAYVQAHLPNFTSVAAGLTPLSGGGTVNYLRADGAWASPPGSSVTIATTSPLTGGPCGPTCTLGLGVVPTLLGGTGASSFTSNLPLIGNGSGIVAQGTVSGNTTTFATATGVLSNGHCVAIDASGNFIDAGGACTTGGGGGTVSAGTANQLTYYASSGTTVVGLASANNGVLVTSGIGVPSIATTLPSALTIPSPTVTGALTATGLVTLADHSTQTANTVIANVSGSTASPTAAALPSCSGAQSALIYTSGTGFGCQAFGSIITASTGTSGHTVPFLDGVNTWSGAQTFTAASIALSKLSTQSANTFVANTTGSTASPTAAAIPSCSGSGGALNYTSGTGLGCVTFPLSASGDSGASTVACSSTSSYHMNGIALTMTPTVSGIVEAIFSSSLTTTSATAGNGISAQVLFGTGTPPTAGAALTGTPLAGPGSFRAGTTLTAAADLTQPMMLVGASGGLTVGTTYWFDVATECVGATGYSYVANNNTVIELGR